MNKLIIKQEKYGFEYKAPNSSYWKTFLGTNKERVENFKKECIQKGYEIKNYINTRK